MRIGEFVIYVFLSGVLGRMGFVGNESVDRQEEVMKERPIIMSADSVRAILSGAKTQTRRVIRPQPTGEAWSMGHCGHMHVYHGHQIGKSDATGLPCPYGAVGDRLWVKEKWWTFDEPITEWMLRDGAGTWPRVNHTPLAYHADGDTDTWRHLKWVKKSPLFMPRWASRLTLEITEVRVQRVQEISTEDIVAEGLHDGTFNPTMGKRWHNGMQIRFMERWDSLNDGRGFPWASNPWVWCISFKRINQ